MADTVESGHHFDIKKLSFIGILVSLGIVFGDIGTSPLYVMKAIVNARESGSTMPFNEYIEGALSCIIWTLTLQTTIKYVIIALRADNKGEGGILALFSLVKNLKKGWLYLIASYSFDPNIAVLSFADLLSTNNKATKDMVV